MPRPLPRAVLLAALVLGLTLRGASQPPAAPASSSATAALTTPAQAASAYDALPLSFAPAPEGAAYDFRIAGPGGNIFLAAGDAVLTLPNAPAPALAGQESARPFPPHDPNLGATPRQPSSAQVVRLGLSGANQQPGATGEDQLPGIVNSFIGNNPAKWRTNIPTYAKVVYHNVYPGVDLDYYGHKGQLEDDFIVAPGADASVVRLALQGADALRVSANGALAVTVGSGTLRLQPPAIYQEGPHGRVNISGGYRLGRSGAVAFALGSYDHSRPLVIDPVLVYSTYLGGSNDVGSAIAVDAQGDAYITGATSAGAFPTTTGSSQPTSGGAGDAFVTKLNPGGNALVYSTYLGGNNVDQGTGIAVDAAGDAYVTGFTLSGNFPTTSGCLQPAGNPGTYAFVTKLNAAGSRLVYSTDLGGGNDDRASGIAVDTAGDAYVTGTTASPDFPITPGAFQTTYPGGGTSFVSKLDPTGSFLFYSTYFGGGAYATAIAVDGAGDAYLTGFDIPSFGSFPTTSGAAQPGAGGGREDAFVTKLNPYGKSLLYSTYLGGSGNEWGYGIAVDGAGDAYITGATNSPDFPTTPGVLQATFGGGTENAFVTKLNAGGSVLLYSTYLGGSNGTNIGTEAHGIAVDGAGDASITGATASPDFPTTTGAVQSVLAGTEDAFVAKINPRGGALLYSTYLGGSGNDLGQGIALDTAGDAYVTGETSKDPTMAANFPVTPGAFQTIPGGVFVAKLAIGNSVSSSTSSSSNASTTSSVTSTTSSSATTASIVSSSSSTSRSTTTVSASGVIPTIRFAIYGGNASLDGQPAPVGAVVNAYCRQQTLCGSVTLSQAGSYRLVVYGDDGSSPAVANYAQPGDSLAFTVNGQPALLQNVSSGSPAWEPNDSTAGNLVATTTVTETLALSAGWRLLSVSVQPSSNDLHAVLASLGSNYDVVFGFDPAAGVTSYFSDPSKSILNNLATLDPLRGYWLHLTAPGTLAISGMALAGTAVPLQPGWNLVGYTGSSSETIMALETELGQRVDVLFGFDPTAGITSYFSDPSKRILNNLSQLSQNQGYWLHLTGGGNLSWGGS